MIKTWRIEQDYPILRRKWRLMMRLLFFFDWFVLIVCFYLFLYVSYWLFVVVCMLKLSKSQNEKSVLLYFRFVCDHDGTSEYPVNFFRVEVHSLLSHIIYQKSYLLYVHVLRTLCMFYGGMYVIPVDRENFPPLVAVFLRKYD